MSKPRLIWDVVHVASFHVTRLPGQFRHLTIVRVGPFRAYLLAIGSRVRATAFVERRNGYRELLEYTKKPILWKEDRQQIHLLATRLGIEVEIARTDLNTGDKSTYRLGNRREEG